jgi:hypothetical protein
MYPDVSSTIINSGGTAIRILIFQALPLLHQFGGSLLLSLQNTRQSILIGDNHRDH